MTIACATPQVVDNKCQCQCNANARGEHVLKLEDKQRREDVLQGDHVKTFDWTAAGVYCNSRAFWNSK